jgi:hypothetical protein
LAADLKRWMISKGNEQEHLGKIKSDVPMMLPILDLTTVIEVMVVVTRLELRKRALVAGRRRLLRQVQGQQQRGGRHHHRCWDEHDHKGVDEAGMRTTKGEKEKKKCQCEKSKKKKSDAPLTMLTEAWEGERLPKGSDRGDREAAVAKRERTARGGNAATERGGKQILVKGIGSTR